MCVFILLWGQIPLLITLFVTNKSNFFSPILLLCIQGFMAFLKYTTGKFLLIS